MATARVTLTDLPNGEVRIELECEPRPVAGMHPTRAQAMLAKFYAYHKHLTQRVPIPETGAEWRALQETTRAIERARVIPMKGPR